MAVMSREEARKIVDKLGRLKGYVSPENSAKLLESMPEVLESVENLREEVARLTKTLTDNLYSKNTRFVFELIQNAEDNRYSEAQANNQQPFLKFTLHNDRIIIDSNEDGFREVDVQAICSTGNSTKKGSQAYIGEKGIGFKSVFKVASKVHIESGAFSFCFKHSRRDDGLGIVTPIFEDHLGLPGGVRTRMALTLTNPHEIGFLIDEFKALPDSSLMFLSKLQVITIAIVRSADDVSETVYSYRYDDNLSRGELTKRSTARGSADVIETFYYHISKRHLSNLPADDFRPDTHEAEVVLAFPLDKDSVPLESQQYVFAFLPIRQVGYNFQVQSDWVTQASREDVFHSARNEAILQGVAECFGDAVLEFCGRDNALRFQWMRYLPSATVSDAFWAKLLPKIVAILRTKNILMSWTQKTWRQPKDLKWVTSGCLDDNLEPLFEDLPCEVYLSSKYHSSVQSFLQQLDVKTIDWRDMMNRIEADLDRPTSRMKASSTGESWHNRSAKLLMPPLKNNWSIGNEIKDLLLIPLQDGSWTSSKKGAVYYPDNNGVPVPTDLGIRLVDRKSLQIASRKELFTILGLEHCVPKNVITGIVKRYYTRVDLACSVAHIRYLYWNLPENSRLLNFMIDLKDQNGDSVYRRYPTIDLKNSIVDDMYFDTDGQYEVRSILSVGQESDASLVEPFEIHLLHTHYEKIADRKVTRHGLTWEQWLEAYADVRRVPRLVNSRDPKKLSNLFQHIVQYHKDKIIGTLNAHWSNYKNLMSEEIVQVLRETTVPCENLTETPLERAYLPVPDLKELARDLGVNDALPFVKLPSELKDEHPGQWVFLHRFGLGHEANLDFYLDTLTELVDNNCDSSTKAKADLFKVYCSIEEHAQGADRERLCKFFMEKAAIYIPAQHSSETLWVKPSKCVWQAPEFIDVRYSLERTEGYRNNGQLKRLFNSVLDIKDADWKLCILQIRENKDRERHSNNIADIYRHIEMQSPKTGEWTTVREEFQQSSLVYVPQNVPQQQAWYPPSSCLWTEHTRISGKVAIAGQYPNLKNFFLERLEVEEPDVSMFVEELKRLATSDGDPSIAKIKDLIKDIDDLGPIEDDLEDLRSYNILPVQGTDGQIRLKNTHDIFAIVDRIEYEKLFKDRVAILDYSIEEAHNLRRFIGALGIGYRCISLSVTEATTAENSTKNALLTTRIRDQAYAIFRCAVHYGVATSQEKKIYHKIRDTDVHVSESISKTITLSLPGTVVVADGARSKLHIESDDRQFRLFVPRQIQEQQHCYVKQLPDMLLSQLGIVNLTAARVFGTILNFHPNVLDGVLNDHGIISLPWTDPITYLAPSEESFEDIAKDTNQATSRLASEPSNLPAFSTTDAESSPAQLTPFSTPSARSRTGSSAERDFYSPTRSSADYLSTPRTIMTSIPTIGRMEATPDDRFSRSAYTAMLDYVIIAAQGARFPLSVTTIADAILNQQNSTPIVPFNTAFGKRSDNQVAHDVRMGATGELYAFELLLKQGLPNFTRDNWMSTIRREVCIHERYKTMGPWPGTKETADIVFKDGDNQELTHLLINHGHLPNDFLRQGARLTYYLEVKTTTKECATRFYMSKAQHQRMRLMALRPGSTEIYIILRVFNLGQKNMGMHIYVDPAKLKIDKDLIFEADRYTVTPKEVEEEL